MAMLARLTVSVGLFVATAAGDASGSLELVRRIYTGPDIPKVIAAGDVVIVTASDSLFFNSRLLVRDVDYRVDHRTQSFVIDRDLGVVNLDDTLVVMYRRLPDWARRWYGRNVPELGVSSENRPPPLLVDQSSDRVSSAGRGVTMSGAKSFRFSARSAGVSEFSQSLSLTINGEVTPGVELTGAITDRGFDPFYGALNSRLSDLDKVNVQLRSKRVTAQLGDITVEGLPNRPINKQVAGASAVLTFPNWHASGTAARPRGRFETARLFGADGFQGPFQVTSGTGQAIVPGSETVWLDGVQLERGANKDYTMDYPAGRVTFTPTSPIDSRSRIEIDFEPLVTAYRQELFASSGGANTTDSTLFFAVGAVREGDDPDNPVAGEFSSSETTLLESSGDRRVFRSGVSADTIGNYILAVDSLPDTVFQYVGAGAGDFSIVFSYVGAGQGAYQFLGSEVYQFVGDNLGDYAPVVELVAPARTVEYQAVVGVRNSILGSLTADVRLTELDRNLVSSLDDDDNGANFYQLRYDRILRVSGRPGSIQARRRMREADFETRVRLDDPDFARRWHLPADFKQPSTELLHEVQSDLSPVSGMTVGAHYGDLRYRGVFDAVRSRVQAGLAPNRRIDSRASFEYLSSTLSDSLGDADGDVIKAALTMDAVVYRGVSLSAGLEHDRRRNTYQVSERGTRYNKYRIETRRASDYIRWEQYTEDTLIGDWINALDRHRLSAGSSKRLGSLTYDATATWQWLARPIEKQSGFLGRLNLHYDNRRRRLNVSSTFLVSEEVRNQRGISYLEVDPGLGDYILEDGQYIPDPDGNYIRVEELLSGVDEVRRGERSFYLARAFDFGSLRVTSEIREELLPQGVRSALWALPFYSDRDQPYLYFDRRYSGDVRLWPISGFHVFTFEYTEHLERRRIVDTDRERLDHQGTMTVRQRVRETYLEESVSVFDHTSDAYYSGAGVIDGYKVTLTVRQALALSELSAGGSYRRADDADARRSEIFAVTFGSRFRIIRRGELRSTIELYRQVLSGEPTGTSYQLTDNRPGEKGAIWSVNLNHGVRDGIRMNFNVSGRHADNRTARIYGRGEVVAGF